MVGQSSSSFVPSVIKTNIPLNDDPAHKDLLLQQYGERIEKLSQQGQIEQNFVLMQDSWQRLTSDRTS